MLWLPLTGTFYCRVRREHVPPVRITPSPDGQTLATARVEGGLFQHDDWLHRDVALVMDLTLAKARS